jgi:hypothetical protein
MLMQNLRAREDLESSYPKPLVNRQNKKQNQRVEELLQEFK